MLVHSCHSTDTTITVTVLVSCLACRTKSSLRTNSITTMPDGASAIGMGEAPTCSNKMSPIHCQSHKNTDAKFVCILDEKSKERIGFKPSKVRDGGLSGTFQNFKTVFL